MNFSSMQTALARYGFDQSDPLAVWLNAAMHEIEGMFDWPFLECGPVNLVVNAGSNSLVLPSDAVKVMFIFDQDNKAKLKFYNRHKFRRLVQDDADQGLLELYTLTGTNVVQVWRLPLANTNVQVLYQSSAADMVNTTDVPTTVGNGAAWPVMLHFPIVQRAASIGLQAENEEDRAKTAQSEFDAAIMRCMAKFSESELDEPTTVEDAQGYLDDAPLRGIAGW